MYVLALQIVWNILENQQPAYVLLTFSSACWHLESWAWGINPTTCRVVQSPPKFICWGWSWDLKIYTFVQSWRKFHRWSPMRMFLDMGLPAKINPGQVLTPHTWHYFTGTVSLPFRERRKHKHHWCYSVTPQPPCKQIKGQRCSLTQVVHDTWKNSFRWYQIRYISFTPAGSSLTPPLILPDAVFHDWFYLLEAPHLLFVQLFRLFVYSPPLAFMHGHFWFFLFPPVVIYTPSLFLPRLFLLFKLFVSFCFSSFSSSLFSSLPLFTLN